MDLSGLSTRVRRHYIESQYVTIVTIKMMIISAMNPDISAVRFTQLVSVYDTTYVSVYVSA